MITIKAIETEYAGHRFRSRLEARWAVFFDALGIRWLYEEEGLALPSGRYLPDFRLQGVSYGTDLLCEVKGTLDHRGLTRLVRSAMDVGATSRAVGPSAALLVLGEVPPPGDPWTHIRLDVLPDGFAFQPVRFAWCAYGKDPGWQTRATGDSVWCDRAWPDVWTESDTALFAEWCVEPTMDPHLRLDPAVDKAYRAARSARFEFSESGHAN